MPERDRRVRRARQHRQADGAAPAGVQDLAAARVRRRARPGGRAGRGGRHGGGVGRRAGRGRRRALRDGARRRPGPRRARPGAGLGPRGAGRRRPLDGRARRPRASSRSRPPSTACCSSTPRSPAARWAPPRARWRSWSAAPTRRTPPPAPPWRRWAPRSCTPARSASGTAFKLARNMMHFVAFTAATEAQRLAEAAGLDLKALGDVVRHTDAITGGPGAIMHRETHRAARRRTTSGAASSPTSPPWARRTCASPSSSPTPSASTYRWRARRCHDWGRDWVCERRIEWQVRRPAGEAAHAAWSGWRRSTASR